ncbi:MAG: class I SAM-dependent methyltransferase [Candidatus Omnitrophota bacterium]|nr:MAG: class I SAM-dependent methyltransferase [Candidatus Omnitrophota bacterium]
MMKNKLDFKLDEKARIYDVEIMYDSKSSFLENYIQKKPIIGALLKNIKNSMIDARDYIFVDGFIEEEAGKLIRKYISKDTVFLEIGCGDLGIRRFLPKDICYNAFDVFISEYALKKASGNKENMNLALACATRIPLDSESVSLVVATEVLEHIPQIDKAIYEIYRVLRRGGILIVSIPNNYCFKYKRKGPHPDHVQNWSFDSFKEYMTNQKFMYLEGFMKGFWLPLPLWLTKASYQVPFSCKDEFYNTNFFYVFKK